MQVSANAIVPMAYKPNHTVTNRNHVTMFIHGPTTNSVEIRALAAAFAEYSSGDLTRIGDYARFYDIRGGKKEEPHYDALMVMIALLSSEKFDENFILKEVDVINPNAQYGRGHIRGVKLLIEATNKTMTRSDMIEYERCRHIFVATPMSKNALENIRKVLATATKKSPIIVHVQGGGVLSKDGEPLDTSNPDVKNVYNLTPKPSIFGTPFNTNGPFSIEFYDLLKHVPTYTVCVRDEAPWTKVTQDKIANGINRGKFKPEKNLPEIYCLLFEHVVKTVCYGKSGHENMFLKLDNALMVQDMYDKDNLSSISILAQQCKEIHLNLVGRECSKLIHKGKEVPVKDRSVVINNRTVPFHRLLAFATCAESSFPGFKSPDKLPKDEGDFVENTEEVFDEEQTRKEYTLMRTAFMQLLNKPNVTLMPKASDWRDDIAISGKTLGDTWMFNVLLFVPGLLYILSILSGKEDDCIRPSTDIKEKYGELWDIVNSITVPQAPSVNNSTSSNNITVPPVPSAMELE